MPLEKKPRSFGKQRIKAKIAKAKEKPPIVRSRKKLTEFLEGKTAYPGFKTKCTIANSQCQVCGWNYGPCDRHRYVPDLGYVQENVCILCPNCHRLVTFDLICLWAFPAPEKSKIIYEKTDKHRLHSPSFSPQLS